MVDHEHINCEKYLPIYLKYLTWKPGTLRDCSAKADCILIHAIVGLGLLRVTIRVSQKVEKHNVKSPIYS